MWILADGGSYVSAVPSPLRDGSQGGDGRGNRSASLAALRGSDPRHRQGTMPMSGATSLGPSLEQSPEQNLPSLAEEGMGVLLFAFSVASPVARSIRAKPEVPSRSTAGRPEGVALTGSRTWTRPQKRRVMWRRRLRHREVGETPTPDSWRSLRGPPVVRCHAQSSETISTACPWVSPLGG